MSFDFDITGQDYPYRAGQHADYTLIDPPHTDDEGNVRTFSFVSSPNNRDSITIATRMRNTAFKNSLNEIPIGTKVKVSEPMGQFTLQKDASVPAVFIAGGIGITPFMSLITYASEEKLPHSMTLFYSNRTQAAAAFLPELEAWKTQNRNFTLVPTLTDESPPNWPDETGRIDMAMIEKYVPAYRTAIFFVAGPPAMVSAMAVLLDQNGIEETRIKAEDFAGY